MKISEWMITDILLYKWKQQGPFWHSQTQTHSIIVLILSYSKCSPFLECSILPLLELLHTESPNLLSSARIPIYKCIYNTTSWFTSDNHFALGCESDNVTMTWVADSWCNRKFLNCWRLCKIYRVPVHTWREAFVVITLPMWCTLFFRYYNPSCK